MSQYNPMQEAIAWIKANPRPPGALYFDGDTYEPKHDEARLRGQWLRVWRCIMYGDWWTLEALAKAVGASEASVSARLRDFRKPRFGGHTIERMRCGNGLFMYRLRTE